MWDILAKISFGEVMGRGIWMCFRVMTLLYGKINLSDYYLLLPTWASSRQ